MCQLLQVNQIHTSVYHPQTDGLVERFNQTQRRMLQQVVDEDDRNWDHTLQSMKLHRHPLASPHLSCSLGGGPRACWTWQRRHGKNNNVLSEPSSNTSKKCRTASKRSCPSSANTCLGLKPSRTKSMTALPIPRSSSLETASSY